MEPDNAPLDRAAPSQGSSNPEYLCQHCRGEQVQELLAELERLEGLRSPLFYERRERQIYAGVGSTTDERFNNETPQSVDPDGGYDLDMSVGNRSNTYVGLGPVDSLLGRAGCPICDLVIHVLPSEFKHHLKDTHIRLILSDSYDWAGPCVATITRHKERSSEVIPEKKLYITATNGGDILALTLGRIQFLSHERARDTQNEHDETLQGPMRDSKHCLSVPQLLLTLRIRDSAQAFKTTWRMLKAPDDSGEISTVPISRNLSQFDVIFRPLVEAVDRSDAIGGETNIEFDSPYEITRGLVKAADNIDLDGLCTASNFPILLIDVETNKLVQQTTATRYLALSYVWGSSSVFKTTSENRKRLEKNGFSNGDHLPKVVRDAMVLTRKLEERYLWVDALCIEQDDETSAQKRIQLQNMDTIYKDAYLTLVAWTATSADSALPGISEPSLPCQVVQKKVGNLILENRLSADLPFLRHYGSISHYETRGWTFQERKLSKRCLFFHHRDALLVDQGTNGIFSIGTLQAVHKSDFNALNDAKSMSQQIYNLTKKAKSVAPKLEQYARLVEEYTSLDLTKATDRLNAFAGFLSYLRSDIGITVAGLPLSSSPRCLLWNTSDDQPLQRIPDFPSWSWAGWQAAVTYLYWSRDDEVFKIYCISGSDADGENLQSLWPLKGENSLDNANFPIIGKPIQILHFHAWIIDSGSNLNGLLVLPLDHALILLTAPAFGDGSVTAMEVQQIGTFSERIRLRRFEKQAWEKAVSRWGEVHLR
ncbi:hypothetical protein E8E14_014445 [Neopestalotiopsis sp. 37M]|nr:hypothetical protein E8E14_014445 [Neopestalotiopsis sp. 37M]